MTPNVVANGGGWIASLQNIITLDDQIELAVAFNSEVENHPKESIKFNIFQYILESH